MDLVPRLFLILSEYLIWVCKRMGGGFEGWLVSCHDIRLTIEEGGSWGDMFQPSVGEGGRF